MSHPQTSSGSAGVSVGRQANRRARELVGREPELAKLEQLLEAVRSGGSGTLFVHGDPGVGKSALLHRLSDSASGFRIAPATGVREGLDRPCAVLQHFHLSLL